MTNEEFNALVFRLEDKARLNPKRYQFRVLLLALLGNAYLVGTLGLLVTLIIGLFAYSTLLKAVAIKLIFVIGFFLWMVLKALWVKIPPPEGIQISASKAPELFSMIKELRRALGAPHFHHVLITEDLNAGVVQVPRLGIFGWPCNYLLIGLPLMKSLTAEQLKAVLAHEFGHLAKGHGRAAGWIYRQRLRWSRVLTALEENESKGSFLFKPFFNWYAPYFNAYSFPLARANEYEADAASVRLTSAVAAAEALTNLDIVGSYLSECYWPKIHKHADELPQPGFTPFSGMAHCVATELDETSIEAWLEKALTRQTTSDDTHPSLADRLKAINAAPRPAPPAPGRSSDQLLGQALTTVTNTFDLRWKDNILPAWEARYREVQEGRSRLAELEAKCADGAELSMQEAYERASLTESIGNNPDAALDQFRALFDREPDNAVACYSLGSRLLFRNDDSGCALIERAIQLDEDSAISGCTVLRDYYWRCGREEEARTWHQRLIERSQENAAAERERNQLSLSDKFDRHDLSTDTLADLRSQLQKVHGLRKAYLVKKRVRHFSHHSCYVFAFSVTDTLRLHKKRHADETLKRIQEKVKFPGETIIINIDGNNCRFGRKFRWMRGTRIL